ncbi:MAG: hypothetical protein H0W43_00250, partial [Chthoniobacterales bacterium]|nr:hypothetical protein [Chthoniobacterales bacterium]
MATCRSPRYFFRMMTLLLWAFFFAAHARAVPNEIWITAVPHADGGSGTELDPFDGSTALKFDALLNSFQSSPGLIIHLGAGTFESDVTATLHWEVKPGWRVQGAGMDETTCKMVGNLAGRRWDHEFFKSAFHSSADHVVIRDLTVDCNWPGLSQTADVGLKGEKFAAIYAIDLRGSDILIENVR